ncbi:hypothetical protein GCM10010145_43390 [Streptomyces ruber]|uniref:Uncharacterized protein n=2 Tax=Streptomyces TaxID=1883 RepID=A0A918BHD9_9ACTN|nr:hypothetical protein GCM10010145_43390 [Streptomyces ruber]
MDRACPGTAAAGRARAATPAEAAGAGDRELPASRSQPSGSSRPPIRPARPCLTPSTTARRGATGDERTALPVAGDSLRAKASAADPIGRPAVDTAGVGPLSGSLRFEPETFAPAVPYSAGPDACRSGRAEAAEAFRSGRAPMGENSRDPGAPLPARRLRALPDETPRVPTAGRVTP